MLAPVDAHDDRTVDLLTEIRDGISRIAAPADGLEAAMTRQAEATIRAAGIHAASWDRLTGAIREQSGALRENAAAWRDGASALRDNAAAWREGAAALREHAGAIREVGFRRPNGETGSPASS